MQTTSTPISFAGSATALPCRDVIKILEQGVCLIETISEGEYTRQTPEVFNASIGGHYRHSLEHFEALFNLNNVADAPALIDYDARPRDRNIENDPEAALTRTKQLIRRFASPGLWQQDCPVCVRCRTSEYEDVSGCVESSLARELIYAIVHAVHHYALIKVICGLGGIQTPEYFGVAPSTLAHEKNTKNAKPALG